MTERQQQTQEFFGILEKLLKECGNPFSFKVKSGESSAVLDNASFYEFKPYFSIDFVYTKQIVRVNLNIPNNVELFEKLQSKRNEIEGALGFKAEWVQGQKEGSKFRRVRNEITFVPNDLNNYKEVAKKAIDMTLQYKKAFGAYLA
jgi:hypothetical protein